LTLAVLNSGILTIKKQIKQVAVCKKINTDKDYQIAKPGKFLFTILVIYKLF